MYLLRSWSPAGLDWDDHNFDLRSEYRWVPDSRLHNVQEITKGQMA
jgi:hypothetical protein